MARAPKVNESSLLFWEGSRTTITGSALAGARVALGASNLPVVSSTESSAEVVVPQDYPVGAADLVITTDCGEFRATVMVSGRPPRILSVRPETPAPAGVLLIRTALAEPSRLVAARIGDVMISLDDPWAFGRPPTDSPDDEDLVGLRVPANTPPGPVEVTLIGAAGASVPYLVQVQVPDPFQPPSPGRVVFPPRSAANDKTFPIASNSTSGPYHVIDPATNDVVGDGSIVYYWRFTDAGESPEVCLGSGKVIGLEKHCAGPCSDRHDSDCRPPDRCHPIEGAFRLSSSDNLVDVTIDRTSSGGRKARYLGGWRSYEGEQPDSNSRTYSLLQLVLRAEDTGLQLVTRNGLSRNCDKIDHL